MIKYGQQLLLNSAALLLFAADDAMAQPTLAAADTAQNAATPVEESRDIIVTANLRAERVQDVAGAITAFRGEDLLNSGATSIADFAGLTPGLQFNRVAGSGAPIVRGLSTGIDTSPTVAAVVNGAPIGSSSSLGVGAQDTLDLDPIDFERVEVLKGPQGTLYGASTLGGLISYALREPDLNEINVLTRAELSFTEGGDPSYSVRGSISTPLVAGQAAIGLSGYYDRRGGFIDNDVRGITNQNEARNWGVRGSLLLQPTERLRISLNGFYQEVRNDATDFVQYNLTTQRPNDGDLRYNDFTLPNTSKQMAAGILNASYEFDFATLSSITSVQHMESDNHQNVTNSATNTILSVLLPLFGGAAFPSLPAVSELNTLYESDRWTQEIRLVSNGEGPFQWIVGGFYSRETDSYNPIFRGLSTSGAPIPALDPALSITLLPTLTEYSAFVNATYAITPRLDITGGIRVGRIEQSTNQSIRGSSANAFRTFLLLQFGTNVPVESDTSESAQSVQTYLGTLRYRFSDDGMVFARIATGFRAGGPNIAGPGLPPLFNPDRTTNYEAGIKTRFLGGRGSIDITGYYTQWRDIIVLFSPAGINGYTNGGDARVYGVEAALTLRPVEGLSLTGTYAFSRGNLTRVSPEVAASFAEGDQLPYSPRHSGSITAQYEAPVGGTWTGFGAATARFTGARFSAFAQDPTVYEMPAYSLFDARAGIRSDRYTIELFVRNLTDSRAQLAATNFNIPEVLVQRPRTFGLAISARY